MLHMMQSKMVLSKAVSSLRTIWIIMSGFIMISWVSVYLMSWLLQIHLYHEMKTSFQSQKSKLIDLLLSRDHVF